MSLRSDLLAAAQTAAAVYRDSGAKERVEHGGFTRVDPLAIAQSQGLLVMLQPLHSLLGAFLREDRPGILVNSDRPPGLMHMTCAHELGHYFLGHQTTADLTMDYGPGADRVEQEADWFAYQLLMPRSLLAHLLRLKAWTANSLADPGIVYQLSLRLGMSFTATVWSLLRHSLLSKDRAAAMAKIPPKRLKEELIGGAIEEAAADVWLLDVCDHDLILEPRPQDHFVVDLPNHVTAGYLWTLNEAQQAGFHLSPTTVDASSVGRPDANHLQFGGRKTMRYQVEHDDHPAVSTDLVRLDFTEQQLWSGGDLGADSFVTKAKFESVNRGLSPQSKALLIDEVSAL